MFLKRQTKTLSALPRGPVEYLVVGLGNPGRDYENTRHNAGFLAVDALAEKLGAKIDRLKFKSLCGDAMIGEHRVLLMKPSTFMNNSGEAVRDAMQFHKIPIEQVLVLFDDVSLDVGRLRIRRQGSDGGHNGIKSILYQLATDTFVRIRIGVGAPPPDWDMADWVLGRFSNEEISHLSKLVDCVVEEAVPELLTHGAERAMNQYNGKVF